MKTSRPRKPPQRAAEILRHFVEHLESADTLEGLARYRLLEDFARQRVEDTDQALQWLVKQGLLEKIVGIAGVPPVYRLNAANKPVAERLLARMTTTRPETKRHR